MGMKILIEICFSHSRKIAELEDEVKLVKDQCRLDIRKYSFSQRTINEWNKLSTDCITASSVNMFKNRVDTSQEGGLNVDEHCWTLNKSMASLSTCHLGLWLGWQILLKLH